VVAAACLWGAPAATAANYGATAWGSNVSRQLGNGTVESWGSNTSCTARSPAHEAGTVEVRATVSKLSSPKGAAAARFTYG
jgi:hypothetical protein